LGEVDAFSIPGLKCYFGSNDHYPQHFHVLKRGHWIIRVFILRSTRTLGLNWNYKFRWKGATLSPEEEGQLLRAVLAHKRRLLREWNDKVCVARERKDSQNEDAKTPGARSG
jgi:hypothetical protein